MVFTVMSEREIIGRYLRTPVKDRRNIVTVLADLTASRRCDMVEFLQKKGVWTEEVFCGQGFKKRSKT